MVAEFMKDFNEVFGMDITAMNLIKHMKERIYNLDPERHGVNGMDAQYLISAEDLEHASAEHLK